MASVTCHCFGSHSGWQSPVGKLRHRYSCLWFTLISSWKCEEKTNQTKTFSYLGVPNKQFNGTVMVHAVCVPLNHVITTSKESKLWNWPSSQGDPAAFYQINTLSYLLHTTFPPVLISTHWYLPSKRQLTDRNSALWRNNSRSPDTGDEGNARLSVGWT